MVTLKCKMCGGDVIPSADQTYGQCDSCGTFSTLPKIDTEQLANLYNRANHLRRQNDFDSALKIYENILSQDDTAAEAHWCAMLCRFGIEYVTDPNTKKKLPTCHRMSFYNILQDVDYLAALKYTPNASTKKLYTDEANYISQVQRYIFSIAQKEDPYDIFICYKETDLSGGRTTDSVEAQNLYDDLTNKGYKVFFARITLEDKLGTLFEPYIFSALHHSKVMLAIGTSKENFNAVWVKNEWSRYLKLCQKDRSRLLIPCYKNMVANDIPEELSKLQCQDMSKPNFSQYLLNGIDNFLKKSAQQVAKNTHSDPNIDSLLNQAFMFLKDGNVDSAKQCFNKVLYVNPKQPKAYIGLLCLNLNLKYEADLKNLNSFFWNDDNFQKAYKCADNTYKATLDSYMNAVKEQYYLKAHKLANENTIKSFEQAIEILNSITDFRDSANYIKHYKNMLDEAIYVDCIKEGNKNTLSSLENAVKNLKTIVYYKDSKNLIEKFQLQYEEQYQKSCNDEILFANAKTDYVANNYNKDTENFNQKNFIDEYSVTMTYLSVLNAKKDKIQEYENAIKTLETISSHKDAQSLILNYKDKISKIKKLNLIKMIIIAAIIIFIIPTSIPIYYYTTSLINYNKANYFYAIKDYENAILHYEKDSTFKDSAEKVKLTYYTMAEDFYANKDYENAILYYEKDSTFKDSAEKVKLTYYTMAEDFNANKNYKNAILYYKKANNYNDSDAKLKKILTLLYNNNISAGMYHTVALKSNGNVIAVGNNDDGQCDVSKWSDIVFISAGASHTVGLKADGLVVAVGNNEFGQCDVSKWSDIVSISAGLAHTVGLKADGTVVAVGFDTFGQCDVSKWSNITSISAGGVHTVGLKDDGLVVATGLNTFEQCDVSKWSDIVSISAGGTHTVGLKADGLVVAVGLNEFEQCDISNWYDIVSISAGGAHTVGLKADGTVVAVGWNDEGQCYISKWSDIVSISAGIAHTVGLKADGTVVAVGDNSEWQCKVSNWSNIGSFN